MFSTEILLTFANCWFPLFHGNIQYICSMEYKEMQASVLFGKILRTIIPLILWLFVVTYMGIYNGWLFFGDAPTKGNIIFYSASIITFILIIISIVRVWKKK
jgi:hypothetical protein